MKPAGPQSARSAGDRQLERSVRALQRPAAQRRALLALEAHRRRLMARCSPAARRYATAILRDRHLAEDAVQEAWCEAFARLPALREARAFPAWFRRVVFKQCDRIRRRSSYRELTGLDSPEQSDQRTERPLHPRTSPDPAELLQAREERRELRRRLQQAYRGLNPTERKLARLRFVEERRQSDIARELQITEDTVKNRVRALRRRLRHELAPVYTAYASAIPASPAKSALSAANVVDLPLTRETGAQFQTLATRQGGPPRWLCTLAA